MFLDAREGFEPASHSDAVWVYFTMLPMTTQLRVCCKTGCGGVDSCYRVRYSEVRSSVVDRSWTPQLRQYECVWETAAWLSPSVWMESATWCPVVKWWRCYWYWSEWPNTQNRERHLNVHSVQARRYTMLTSLSSKFSQSDPSQQNLWLLFFMSSSHIISSFLWLLSTVLLVNSLCFGIQVSLISNILWNSLVAMPYPDSDWENQYYLHFQMWVHS